MKPPSLALVALLAAGGCASSSTTRIDIQRAVGALSAELVCLVEEPREPPAAFDPADGCIHYDPIRLDAIALEHGRAVTVAAIAHELGHHLQQQRGGELEEIGADELAGCALAVLGEPLGPYLDFVGGHHTAPTDARAAAVLRGAERCAPAITNGR